MTVVGRKIPSLGRFWSVASWPFAVKFAVTPLVAVAMLALLAWFGGQSLQTQQATIDEVATSDLGKTSELSAIGTDLSQINGEIYRIMTFQAGGAEDLDLSAGIEAILARIDALILRIEAVLAGHDLGEREAEFASTIERLKEYKGAVELIGSMLELDFASSVNFVRPFDEHSKSLMELVDHTIQDVSASAILHAEQSSKSTDRILSIFIAAVVGAGLAVVAIAFWIERSTSSSIQRIANATLQIAEGDASLDLDRLRRGDELQAIVGSLKTFRDKNFEAAKLQEEQDIMKAQSEEERRTAIMTMAENVEHEASILANRMGEASERMIQSTKAMANTSQHVLDYSNIVAGSAEQSMLNLNDVAGTSSELATSIQEISIQVGRSRETTSHAVDAGRNAEDKISSLTNAVDSISEVVTFITDIASQTNLLALNATIEAARAGASGKGFAVVAQEVKALAIQTAKSTKEIEEQISEVQASTKGAVNAVQDITRHIQEMNEIAATVSAAIEEQNAATQGIASNVDQARGAAEEVSNKVQEVNREVEISGGQARELEEIVTQVSGDVAQLQQSITAIIRTAVPDADRRRSPRIACNTPCTLVIEGERLEGVLVSLSHSGFMLRFDGGAPALTGAGQLIFKDMEEAVTIVGATGGDVRGTFDEPSNDFLTYYDGLSTDQAA